jgi:hypothetical protein
MSCHSLPIEVTLQLVIINNDTLGFWPEGQVMPIVKYGVGRNEQKNIELRVECQLKYIFLCSNIICSNIIWPNLDHGNFKKTHFGPSQHHYWTPVAEFLLGETFLYLV